MDRFRICRTLIVENDILVCSLIEEMLRLIGFDAINTASCAKTALHLVQQSEYDLVMLAWALDRDLMTAIQSLPIPRKPLLVATGCDADPRHRLTVIRAGAAAYIKTPFSTANVLFTMDHVLHNFTATRQGQVIARSKPVAQPAASERLPGAKIASRLRLVSGGYNNER